VSGLKEKKIILGVTGGVAAYKIVELARLLIKSGAQVRVIMTATAKQFVGVATFQAVTANPVLSELFDEQHEAAMGHIELARWADLIVVAPASADFMAKIAHGFANDLLSTLILAAPSAVVVVPAMNQQMWSNPATIKNTVLISENGIGLWGPASGEQACGDVGAGRMIEAIQIHEKINKHLSTGIYSGVRALVTAGPTHERIDPVRFLGNKSSGKMGYAIAEALVESGAQVTLISGPVNLLAPPGIALTKVETAEQMYEKVLNVVEDQDIVIACAAVADYRPEFVSIEKIKKTEDDLTLKLVRNPDIIAAVTAVKNPPFTLGFAAETNNLEANAKAKIKNKKLDMIAANQVGLSEQGIGSEMNALSVFWEDGQQNLELQNKKSLARQLIQLLHKQYTLNKDAV